MQPGATRLSQAQFHLWLGHQRAANQSTYNAAEAVWFEGALDANLLIESLSATLAEAEALQLRFDEVAGEPSVVHSARADSICLEDLTAWPDPIAEMERRTCVLLAAPLWPERGHVFQHRIYRVGATTFAWLHVAHHIVLDGYGFHLIARRVSERYEARVSGRALPDGAFGSFAAVLQADCDYQASSDVEADRRYWHQVLEGKVGGSLSAYLPRQLAHGVRVRRPMLGGNSGAVAPLGAFSYQDLCRLAAEWGGSWPEVLLASVAAYTYYVTGHSGQVLGVPAMLRFGTPAARVPCMAMNINPLPVRVGAEDSLRSLAQQIRATQRSQRPHQRYRYEQLRQELPRGACSLFGPSVNIMPFDAPLAFGQCVTEARGISAGPVESLALGFIKRGNGLELEVDGHPDLFGKAELQRIAGDYLALFERLVRCPEGPLGAQSGTALPRDLYPLGAAGAPAAAEEQTAATLAAPFAQLLEFQAVKQPQHMALQDGAAHWTYAELHRLVSGVSLRLSQLGYRTGDLIALAMPRCAASVIGLLGVLAAGMGYLVLDPGVPQARRQRCLESAKPRALLRLASGSADLKLPVNTDELLVDMVRFNAWGECDRKDGPAPAAHPEHAAYVVYTSGSSGEPKGVVVSHGALQHFLWAAQRRYRFAVEDRVLQFAPLGFDASVEEILVTLVAGATLVLRDEAMMQSTAAFLETCGNLGITVLDLPTAYWHELVLGLETQSLRVPATLRTVIIGGEAALEARVRSWLERAPGCRLLNTYGPTEATVVATVSELNGAVLEHGVPIGRPLEGVGVGLLSLLVTGGEQSVQLLQGDVDGELCIWGPTLACGYLDRLAEERLRFVHVEAPPPDSAPLRVYRTGDKVWRKGNELVYLGRVDDEIKLSGYRISPQEVESVLRQCRGVEECVVLARADDSGTKHLVAHVQSSAHALTVEELRELARSQLPAAMVPSVFEIHPALPRSAHGKLDRQLLRDWVPASPRAEAVCGTETELLVAAVWRQVLGLAVVELDDDFFAIGGQSLQVVQVANRLSKDGVSITAAMVFRHPTPRQLAAVVNGSVAPVAAFRSVGEEGLPLRWFDGISERSTKRSIRRVILTGATGFLGVHLLRRLLLEPVEVVLCPVRARDAQSARGRLLAALAANGFGDLDASRVEVRCVDLCNPWPGWAENGPHDFWDLVLHCAAEVSVARNYESLRAANVGATRELLGIAAASGCAFHHVSSLAVVAGLLGTAPEEFVERHAGLADGYQQTKWQAEEFCRQAGCAGLPVAVYRLGRLTGSMSRPCVNPRDLVWRLARSATRAGSWPDLDLDEVWTPVDIAADQIVKAALVRDTAGVPARVLQLASQGTVNLDRVRLALGRAGFPLTKVAQSEWLERVARVADDEDLATLSFFELNQASPAAGRAGVPPTRLGHARHWSCERLLRYLPDAERAPVSDLLLDAYCGDAHRRGMLACPSVAPGLGTA